MIKLIFDLLPYLLRFIYLFTVRYINAFITVLSNVTIYLTFLLNKPRSFTVQLRVLP